MRFEAVFLGCFVSLGMTGALQAPIPGYGVEELEWEVEVTPGGEMVKANGTVEQVVAHLKTLNPNFDDDYAVQEGRNLTDLEFTAPTAPTGNVSKRYEIESYFCHGRWAWCESTYVRDGVYYLNSVRGSPVNGPGPGNCGRVSCSWRASIWWCNDNKQSKTLGDFRDIADGASHIERHCSEVAYRPGGIPVIVTSGQVFYKDHWNVIVRYDSDNC
ncbi:hypothetical protein V8F06_001538 [Rhypophila decipiens]